MKKVAIFGNTGGGKSTLAKAMADITGLPLVSIDKIMYLAGGDKIPHSQYLDAHAGLIANDKWIIDGYGCVPSAWQRFSVADTLVYVDLPLYRHFIWVTKRFVKGIFINPEGWPERSPMIRSTISGYRVLWLCHRKLTPRYRQFVSGSARDKNVVHLKSPQAIKEYLNKLQLIQETVRSGS